MQDLVTFIQTYLGKPDTGDTPENLGQCVGLVEVWWAANKKPWVPGNAVDLMANAPKLVFSITDNEPDNAPKAGDVVCWDGSWGAGDGHTAVVVAATRYMLVVFEQNDPEGSPPVVATHDYSGVEGWISMR